MYFEVSTCAAAAAAIAVGAMWRDTEQPNTLLVRLDVLVHGRADIIRGWGRQGRQSNSWIRMGRRRVNWTNRQLRIAVDGEWHRDEQIEMERFN